MPDNTTSNDQPGSSKPPDKDPPDQPHLPWGPIKMARMLMRHPVFRGLVKQALADIEKADVNIDGTVGKAAEQLKWLNGYYSTRDTTELADLNLSKDNQAALMRCTDRNNLIVIFANLEKVSAD